MVCKKSLYCWKNGPCASDQTRKQIWEDNIRFRESLRNLNQSDHYWSFQISKNLCLCLEGEDVFCQRPQSRRYRSGSLQRLHQNDCTSVTHDFNGLKFRNCFVHCPIHDYTKDAEEKRAATPLPQSISRKATGLNYLKYPLRPLPKSDGDKPEYCHRYKNTLSSSSLKPSIKMKFPSQSNLNSISDSKKTSVVKKALHSSCEDLASRTKESRKSSPVAVSVEKCEDKKTDSDAKEQKENVRPKVKELKALTKPLNRETPYEYTPVSRTTRKMLSENKKIPFITYGCNNTSHDIGSKRTHNVLASKLEVYPNALLAKQHKRDLILKYIQNEKEFQKKCLPEDIKRRLVNHSSLWSLDYNGRKDKSLQRKNTKYILPLMKPAKKQSLISNQFDSAHFKTYRKPQIYFY